MKIFAILLNLNAACDVSSNAKFINFRRELARIDDVITDYFEFDGMNNRQSKRYERVRERYEDKVERISAVIETLYCRCGTIVPNTPLNNLQLIASLPSGKRKRRSSDNMEADLEVIIGNVESWYQTNLASCTKSQGRLASQVTRMRTKWAPRLGEKLNLHIAQSDAEDDEEEDDQVSPQEALNTIMSLNAFG